MRRASSTLVLGTIPNAHAHVVKLVNTLHSGCSEQTLLEVRVFSWAHSNPVNNWIFLFISMRIVYLHTNPAQREIDDLISDITSNFISKDNQLFEIQYMDFKWFRLSSLIKLRRFLKENKIDIIHTFNYIDTYYTLMASFGLNVKVAFSCYSYFENLKGIHKRILKTVMSKVDAVIFQTEIQKKKFTSDYPNASLKFFKLFHAFSSKRLDNYKYESIRDEYFIDDYRYLIGTLGDISPKHDVMTILKMVKKLRKSGRNFTCLISGGVYENNDTYFDECKYYFLMQGLDNYINYVGDRKDHANYLSQLDVFVYHSDNEVIAMPVIEAMMMGLNVVVNDDEMIREITHNGKYATLYKSKDALDFAEKTRSVLQELEDYRIIAETIKEESRDIFSIERHIHELKEIYKNIKNN